MLTRPRFLAVAAIYIGVSLLQVQCAPTRPAVDPAPLPADEALVDTSERTVPRKPYDWQKKPSGNPPRCGSKEREIYGACYRRAHPDDYSPPCEAPTVEHDGTCYYTVQAPRREPSSIQR